MCTTRRLSITVLFALSVSACSLFTPANLPKTELVGEEIACVLEHAFLNDAALNTACNFVTAEKQAAAKKVAGLHRASLAKEMAAQRMAIAHCDAGIEAGK